MTEDVIAVVEYFNATVLVASVLSGWSVSQAVKMCRHYSGHRTRRWALAVTQMLVTGSVAYGISWATGMEPRAAIAPALTYGPASPVLFVVLLWALRKWAPELAVEIGESRRNSERRKEVWTEGQREKTRALFEDSGCFSKEEIEKAKNGE